MDDFARLRIKELRQRCQSNAPEAGRDPLLGYTIRFFSIYLTKYIFLRTPITPNWITVIGVLVFFGGISLYLFDDMALQLIGSFLIWFSVVLDGCDGEMARLRGNPSGVGGIYTEPVSHDIMYAVMFFPVAIGLWLSGFPAWILIIGWIAATGKLLQRFLTVRFDKVRAQQKEGRVPIADGEGDPDTGFNPNVSLPHKLYRFVNRNFFSSVGFVIPLTVGALLGHVEWALYAFALYFAGNALLHFSYQVLKITRISRKNKSVKII